MIALLYSRYVFLKGIILSSFTHPHIILQLYVFISSTNFREDISKDTVCPPPPHQKKGEEMKNIGLKQHKGE